MNSLELLNDLFKRLQDDSPRLSVILPQLYQIALECEDYEGLILFCLWEKPVIHNKGASKTQRLDIRKMLSLTGLQDAKIDEIEQEAFEKYILMRNVAEDQVATMSAKEMEDYFDRVDKIISAIAPLDGLPSVDLYYRCESVAKAKLKVIGNRQEVDRQYAILQNCVLDKLAYYKIILAQREGKKMIQRSTSNSKKVFLIHGRNEAKRRELKDLLQSEFGLEVVILSEQPNQGMTIIEKFEKYAAECSYALALFTPDDIVTPSDGEQYFQARPNVIFELGWFYANLGRSRVCIIDQASEKSAIFSDLQGVMRIQFHNDISEKALEIRRELALANILENSR